MKKAIAIILTLVLALSVVPVVGMAEAAVATEENTYWNDTLKIGTTLDADWYILTEEEVAQVYGATTEQLDEQYAQAMEQSGSYIDMYAINQANGATLNVTVEKLSDENAKKLTEEDYMELSLESLIPGLEQVGMTEIEHEFATITIDGEEHGCIGIAGVVNDADLFEVFAVIKDGNNMILVCCASADLDYCIEVVASFYREQA